MLDIIPFLSAGRHYFLALHLLGFALGLGSALLADLFLFKFIKEGKLNQKEVNVLKTFSQIIWAALIFFAISGIALTLPKSDILSHSAKFQVKMIVVLVIITNGVLLNTLISPKLLQIFGEKYSPKLRFFRRLSFALGAVSFTSWFTAFLLSVFRNLQINFLSLLAIYLGILAFGVLISQIIESRFSQKAPQKAWPF